MYENGNMRYVIQSLTNLRIIVMFLYDNNQYKPKKT